MAWSWSHTSEAYRDAEANLISLPQSYLVEILAEWKAWDGDTFAPNIDVDKFDAIIESGEYSDVDPDILARAIWDKASDHKTGRTCTNGGHDAWMCPFGCTKHMVSFTATPETLDRAGFDYDPTDYEAA